MGNNGNKRQTVAFNQHLVNQPIDIVAIETNREELHMFITRGWLILGDVIDV